MKEVFQRVYTGVVKPDYTNGAVVVFNDSQLSAEQMCQNEELLRVLRGEGASAAAVPPKFYRGLKYNDVLKVKIAPPNPAAPGGIEWKVCYTVDEIVHDTPVQAIA